MSTRFELPKRIAVMGFSRSGRSTARALVRRGVEVIALDDSADLDVSGTSDLVGLELLLAPSPETMAAALEGCGLVVVSPGVPPTHQIFSIADPALVLSEVELASRLLGVPIAAITGTNGKTTVTELVTGMLVASGVAAKALGNIGDPLIDAVDDRDLELAVVEVSSFQLALTTTFSPAVATWLNAAPDHLDWHRDLDDYYGSKERIFANQSPDDVAVVNADDDVVASAGQRAHARVVTFGLHAGDYHVEEGSFVGPHGDVLAQRGDLRRAFPHDQLNALAALATALEAGASPAGSRRALRTTMPSAHRVAFVTSVAGVEYYDDSKATSPAAVVAALAGFDSVVLICGGRNKGLDLASIAQAVSGTKLRGVVAIGEATEEVAAAFADYPLRRAASMKAAVETAARLAEAGDAVLLSPGCASFDWYRSYAARGDDFIACVERLRDRLAPTGQGA